MPPSIGCESRFPINLFSRTGVPFATLIKTISFAIKSGCIQSCASFVDGKKRTPSLDTETFGGGRGGSPVASEEPQ